MGFQSYIKHIMYDLLGKHSIRHQFAHFCRLFGSVDLRAFSVDGMWHHLSEKNWFNGMPVVLSWFIELYSWSRLRTGKTISRCPRGPDLKIMENEITWDANFALFAGAMWRTSACWTWCTRNLAHIGRWGLTMHILYEGFFASWFDEFTSRGSMLWNRRFPIKTPSCSDQRPNTSTTIHKAIQLYSET